MGRNSSPELMLLLLFNPVVWMEAGLQKTIYFPAQKVTWPDARQFCQMEFIDMVTWNTANIDLLTIWLVKENLIDVWLGLHEDPEQPLVWRWIDVKLQFICYDDNLVLVTQNKTWEEALDHCRKMSTETYKYDLLSIARSSDFSYVRDRIYRATTEEVWTGLRFLGGEWWWSDGLTLNNQKTLPTCPSQWKHCGTLSKNDTADWISRDCSERRNFICYYEEVENRD